MGRGQVLLLAGALLAAAVPDAGADPAGGFRKAPRAPRLVPREVRVVPRERRLLAPRLLAPRPFFVVRPRGPIRRFPRLLPPPDPDENLPPPVSIPSPLLEDRPDDVPPLSHGFVLTVPVGGEAGRPRPALLTRYRDVGTALAACWAAPARGWASITVRVAFRRDGTVYGTPRIPFVDATAPDTKTSLARSLNQAVSACAPLAFSSSLGAAVAGEIFAIRFINKGVP